MCTLPQSVRVIKSKEIRFAGHVSRTRGGRNASKTFIAKPDRNEPLRITWLRKFQGTEYDNVNWFTRNRAHSTAGILWGWQLAVGFHRKGKWFWKVSEYYFAENECTGSPTRYRTRNFFNNSNTNEDIATKFEQEYVRCVRNVTTS